MQNSKCQLPAYVAPAALPANDPREDFARLGELLRIHIEGRGTFSGRCIGMADHGPNSEYRYIAYDAPDGTHTVWLPAGHASIELLRTPESGVTRAGHVFRKI
jgi:hypothetical protein